MTINIHFECAGLPMVDMAQIFLPFLLQIIQLWAVFNYAVQIMHVDFVSIIFCILSKL